MNFSRNIVVWVVIAITLFSLFNLFRDPADSNYTTQLAYSDFLQSVEQGEVREIVIQDSTISGYMRNDTGFTTYAPNDPNLVEVLVKKGVRVVAKPSEKGSPSLLSVLISWFPMILLIGVWIFFMRQMQGGGGRGVMGFGKSRAKMLTEKTERVTFENVAGVEEAKQELEEVVEFLKSPQKFQRLGGKIPKGCLLVGPPGTGKTLLARAIAGEANVPFFTISGSDFVEMFVGVGASRVRDMFEQAKKSAPCILFIDEIDAVGRRRGAGLGGGNDEREQTLNQLLVEMDGFETTQGIILIAATNRPDVLDPALLRAGRFDRQVIVPNPDVDGREAILEVHMKTVPVANDVNARIIARGTPGFSGADLANLVNEAALLAARKSRRVVTMVEFESAKDKVMMGSERRSMVMTEDEKRLTAWHEAGHALVALHVPKHAPLHKVTIIPRGRALGLTMSLPERDQLSQTKVELESHLAMAFGGRVAEELIFGKENITTGAGNDIQQASNMARRMVTEFGFSEKLGPLRYADNEEEVFLGHSVSRQKHISDETAALIDQEVRQLIETAETTARKILSTHKDQLDLIAEALLEYETLSGAEINSLLKGDGVNRQNPPGAARTKRPSVPSGGTQAKAVQDAKPVGPHDAEPQPGT